MDLDSNFPLSFNLGGTIEQNVNAAIESSWAEDAASPMVELFVRPGEVGLSDEPIKLESMVRDGLCVTCKMLFTDPDLVYTLYGVPVSDFSNRSPSDLARELSRKGIRALYQYNGVVLPDKFITVSPAEWIMWWDPVYWGEEGFVDSAVALRHEVP